MFKCGNTWRGMKNVQLWNSILCNNKCFSAQTHGQPCAERFCDCQILKTRRYGTLQVPTSSSCGGLVAFSHLQGPLGPLDSCKKINCTPIWFIGAPPYTYLPATTPPTLAQFFFFFFFAILDFTYVKNVTEGREGDQACFFYEDPRSIWRGPWVKTQ